MLIDYVPFQEAPLFFFPDALYLLGRTHIVFKSSST